MSSENIPEEPVSGEVRSSPSSASVPRPSRGVDSSNCKIGFIGAGKIAESIINGLISYGKIEPNRCHVSAPSTKNLERLKNKYGGIHVTKRSIDIFGRYDCDVVFLCVHGSVIKECYTKGGTQPTALTTNYIPNMKHPLYVLSLVTGFDLNKVRRVLLNPDHPEKYLLEMHRIMLNCACAYGLGICAVDAELDGRKLAPVLRSLLSSIAKLEYVPENQMDAACAVCGSGLAFSYYFMNAMADGAFKMGLSRETAVKMAAKTMQCAAQALLESGKHPGELKDDVSSPSGSATYGIHVLDRANVASGVAAAIEAAHKRADDLAKMDNP